MREPLLYLSLYFKTHREYYYELLNNVRHTGEPCPKCGEEVLIREGKRGEFFACSAYPECKYSKSIGIGIACPIETCDGEVTALRGKRGKPFYGCTNYPNCSFVSWDPPVMEKCPDCGNPFLVRKDYKRKNGHRQPFTQLQITKISA